MKRLFKKNQIIITTLAIMIAVAGYLNYSGRIFGESGKAEATNGELANQELLVNRRVRMAKEDQRIATSKVSRPARPGKSRK